MPYTLVAAESDYLTHAASAPVTGTPLTIACWYKPTVLSGTIGVVSLAASGSNADYFMLGTSGTSVYALTRSTAGGLIAATKGTLVTGAWQHMVGVWASATSIKAYRDGGGGTVQTTSNVPGSVPNRAAIGCVYRTSPTQFSDGVVGPVSFWNVALTDAEVASLAAGADPSTVQGANLVSHVPLTGNVDPELDSVWAAQSWARVGTPVFGADTTALAQRRLGLLRCGS